MTQYNASFSDWITSLFAKEDAHLQAIRSQSLEEGLPAIQIQPEEGLFLQFLVMASQAARAVEFGTLGGYSGTWIARGLQPGGKLITVEQDETHAKAARTHFDQAGVQDLVEVWVGDGHTLYQSLSSRGPFDFVFIDAEKPGYPLYLDWAVENVRDYGVIAAHNAFQGGKLLEHPRGEAGGMLEFLTNAARHPTLTTTVFPAGDGMLIAVKRPNSH
jgi:caffeoyl-CoA O-methyltransferase